MSQLDENYGSANIRRILAGTGCIRRVGPEAADRGIASVLVCTDPGIVAAGIVQQLESSLRGAGIAFDVLPEVEPEPPIDSVKRFAAAVRSGAYDAIIGIGGGSSMDVAKLAAAAAGNDVPVRDFVGIDTVPSGGLPTILIPTTAGTGSEVTPNAIVTLTDEGRKAAAVSPRLLAEIAVMDPELTVGLSPSATAATGLDAFIHSLESFIGLKHNLLGDGYATTGMSLVYSSLEAAVADGSDLRARERVLMGSMFGGLALSASGTAAVHALAYAIGARYGIPHGLANSMLLMPVLERSIEDCADRLGEAGAAMGIGSSADRVLDRLGTLIRNLKLNRRLVDFGGQTSDIAQLSESSLGVTRLLDNHPKRLARSEIESIFQTIM